MSRTPLQDSLWGLIDINNRTVRQALGYNSLGEWLVLDGDQLDHTSLLHDAGVNVARTLANNNGVTSLHKAVGLCL